MDKLNIILERITSSQELKYFVCSETNGDSAFIGEYGIYPDDVFFGVAYKDFDAAKEYFEKSGKGYNVYHLKEGLKVVFNRNQMIVNDDDIDEDFFKSWKDLIG